MKYLDSIAVAGVKIIAVHIKSEAQSGKRS